MNRFEDERICFFLRHRQLIKEWAAIEADIPKETHRFLSSLADDIGAIATESVTEAIPFVQLWTDYPHLMLTRPCWQAEASLPRAAIGIEWARKSVNLESAPPYVGVAVFERGDRGEQLRGAITAHCAALAKVHGYKAFGWFPCLKYVRPPDPAFWENLDPYRTLLGKNVIDTWKLFAETVDQVITSANL